MDQEIHRRAKKHGQAQPASIHPIADSDAVGVRCAFSPQGREFACPAGRAFDLSTAFIAFSDSDVPGISVYPRAMNPDLLPFLKTHSVCFQYVAHSFALPKIVTSLLSAGSALFGKNTGGGGCLALSKAGDIAPLGREVGREE
jgi:hypothetical protein